MNVSLDIAGVLADLDAIDAEMSAQAQQIVSRAATTFERAAKASTPVGKAHRGRRPLSTGWVRRDTKDAVHPHIAVANIRPHAHLAAEGFQHVGGKRVPPFVPWIRDAIRVREQMVNDLEHLLQGGLHVPLRALEVTA